MVDDPFKPKITAFLEKLSKGVQMPFFLKLEGELLATLTPFELDFAWWTCEITTTEKFSLIEDLIRRVSNTDDMELVDEVYCGDFSGTNQAGAKRG